jgi:uncharacterized membrane protein YdjX (TVP38/TMEM64 family)
MKKLISVIVVITVLVSLYKFHTVILGTLSWFGSREAVSTSMERAGLWGPVILFILFVLQVFLAFIPGQALMIASGYLYGFWGGFLLSWISLVVGGEIAYLLARKYGRPFAEKWISPAVLERWNKAAAGQGVAFFAISLVMPLVPNDAMCYVAGLGTISRIRFSTANLLGRGMACLVTSAAGAYGGNLSWQGWAFLIAIFVLIGIIWQIARNSRYCHWLMA